jgi:hypothetical protein
LEQKKWISKLLGYDFEVEYKKGIENKIADALSRWEGWEEELSLSLLAIPTVNLDLKSKRNIIRIVRWRRWWRGDWTMN